MMAHVSQRKLYFMLQKRMRKKMTKKFHVCDDKCEPAGTGIHNNEKKPKVVKKTKAKAKAKSHIEGEFINNMKPKVVNVYKNKPKIEAVWQIINIIDAIDNPLETNKVLEKTLITLRKLQQDIAN